MIQKMYFFTFFYFFSLSYANAEDPVTLTGCSHLAPTTGIYNYNSSEDRYESFVFTTLIGYIERQGNKWIIQKVGTTTGGPPRFEVVSDATIPPCSGWQHVEGACSGNTIILEGGCETIEDTEDPTAVCQNFTAELDADGEVIVSGNDVDGGSSDNSGSFTITLSQDTFDCSDIGTTTPITVTVTDPTGNSDTCSADITVIDAMGPSFNCFPNTTVPCEGFYVLPDYVANGDVTVTDNCSTGMAISQTPAAGTQLTDGIYTVSFESTDDEGNTSDCSFELTVEEILGIPNESLNAGLSIFPNPATNAITVSSANESLTSITIVDVAGKTLIDVSNVNLESQTIDVSTLSQGIYFVNINNKITKRITKK